MEKSLVRFLIGLLFVFVIAVPVIAGTSLNACAAQPACARQIGLQSTVAAKSAGSSFATRSVGSNVIQFPGRQVASTTSRVASRGIRPTVRRRAGGFIVDFLTNPGLLQVLQIASSTFPAPTNPDLQPGGAGIIDFERRVSFTASDQSGQLGEVNCTSGFRIVGDAFGRNRQSLQIVNGTTAGGPSFANRFNSVNPPITVQNVSFCDGQPHPDSPLSPEEAWDEATQEDREAHIDEILPGIDFTPFIESDPIALPGTPDPGQPFEVDFDTDVEFFPETGTPISIPAGSPLIHNPENRPIEPSPGDNQDPNSDGDQSPDSEPDPNAEEDPSETDADSDIEEINCTTNPDLPWCEPDIEVDEDCEECELRVADEPSFVVYFADRVSDRFPFDILNLPSDPLPNQCPVITGLFDYQREFCFVNNVFSAFKYAGWLGYVIKILTSI